MSNSYKKNPGGSWARVDPGEMSSWKAKTNRRERKRVRELLEIEQDDFTSRRKQTYGEIWSSPADGYTWDNNPDPRDMRK